MTNRVLGDAAHAASITAAPISFAVRRVVSALGVGSDGVFMTSQVEDDAESVSAVSGVDTESRRRIPGAGSGHLPSGQSNTTPADVDGLLETLQGTKTSDAAAATILEGEHLFATERMVVSPGAGIFAPNESCVDGSVIEVGQLLGTVGSAEVRSSFAGEIKGVLAYDGERVTSRQPIAWLRTTA